MRKFTNEVVGKRLAGILGETDLNRLSNVNLES